MATQLDMWGEPDPAPARPPALTSVPAAGQVHVPRPYQEAAIVASLRELETVQSTIVVMATGTGKSVVFTEIARRRPNDRVLFLAHKDELLRQGMSYFEPLGERVGLDQAEWFGGDERIIVGSVQTVSMPDRLRRFDPKRFDLIITDEIHHGPCESYRRIYEYFSEAKRWGCTATADRLDGKALGMVADSVAYVYDIQDGIQDGWLCDVRCKRIEITGLDLSHVKTVAGDLNQGELDAVMKVEKVLLGVVDATIREAGTRPTIVFATSVENADKMAEIFCRNRKGCAFAVNGKTDMDKRRALMADFKSGKFQFLCNVAIAIEGLDVPICSCISMARPTKSRAFYVQAAGRALRPHPSKQDALILDFCGNSGRHRLVTALDILGGRYTEEEEALARKLVDKNPGMRVRDALDQAHAQAERLKQIAEEAARKAHIKAHASYVVRNVDPFAARVLHVSLQKQLEMDQARGATPATGRQKWKMRSLGIEMPAGCTTRVASKLISTELLRRDKWLATTPQLMRLQKRGINDVNISEARAQEVLGALDRNPDLSFAQLQIILHRQREPGED